MRQLFLIGFMGAGKSTVGRLVAERIGRPFVDLDEVVETRVGRPVREIFDTEGEETFRLLETAALETLLDAEPSVVACGGGIVLSDSNRALLSRLDGFVVYLKVTAGETLARVGADGTRPLLSGPGGTLAATSLLEARQALYMAVADATVDTVGRSADQVADEVALLARERGIA
jgi:shikimate kinase